MIRPSEFRSLSASIFASRRRSYLKMYGVEWGNLPVTGVFCSSAVSVPELGRIPSAYRPDMCSFACEGLNFGTSNEWGSRAISDGYAELARWEACLCWAGVAQCGESLAEERRIALRSWCLFSYSVHHGGQHSVSSKLKQLRCHGSQ